MKRLIAGLTARLSAPGLRHVPSAHRGRPVRSETILKTLVIFILAMMASVPTYGAFSFDLDVDLNGEVNALTDGLLAIRYTFGFRGAPLVDEAVGENCGRCTAQQIEAYLASLGSKLDVDGNGEVEPLTDCLLLLRYFFGFRGGVLLNGAVDADCTHCTIGDIEAYLGGLTAFDDIFLINDPLHNNGLTIYPLRPLENDLIAHPDTTEIVYVLQPVINFCDPVNDLGWQSGSGHGPECWRQIGVVSINPDGRSVTLDLNPGVLPLWNPSHPWDGTTPPKAEACGLGLDPEPNPEPLGDQSNPMLFCMTSNSSPWPMLAYMPTPPLGSPPCDYAQPTPWNIPFQYWISEGVHLSSATATIRMYTPPCIILPNWVPNLLGGPPPGPPPEPLPTPDPVTNTLPFGTLTLTLDTNLLDASASPSSIPGWGTPSALLTMPATCPQIPNVQFLDCEVTGQVAMDPGAEILYNPDGVIVQLTDPLKVVNGGNDNRGFISVSITSVLECQECAIKRYWGTLFGGATPSCYLNVNGNRCYADCVTGEVFDEANGCTPG